MAVAGPWSVGTCEDNGESNRQDTKDAQAMAATDTPQPGRLCHTQQ